MTSGSGGGGVVNNAVSSNSAGIQAGEIHGGILFSPARTLRPDRLWFGEVPPRAECYQHRAVRLGRSPIQVLSGLGGVGKTQIAADHAHQAWESGEIDLLVWITASSREAVLAAYAELAVRLTGAPGRLTGWLATTEQRWLVVLDDVQSPADLRDLWPPENGRTIITTRRTDAALRGRLVPVELFTPAESAAYLREKLQEQPRLAEQTAELAEDLGHLPLALAQAAAYILDRQLSCADYRRRFADRHRGLASLLPDPEGLPEDQATVATTYSLSVERANQLAPVGQAEPVLHLACVLDPNGVPLLVFDAEDERDALTCLQRLSLVKIDWDAEPRVVRVHGLVQRAVYEQIPLRDRESIARAAADRLYAAWPPEDTGPALARLLRANTEALRARADGLLWDSEAHPVLIRLGRSLGEHELAAEAAKYFAELRDLAVERLGPAHPQTLTARIELGYWQGEAGDLDSAAATHEQVLADAVALLGPEHPDVLSVRNNTAVDRGRGGDPAGAVTELTAVLAARLAVLGPDHPHTLISQHNLAFWQAENSELDRAVAGMAAVVAGRLRVLGPEHPATLNSRLNLGTLRGRAGQRRKSMGELARLLTDELQALGPEHQHTLRTRHNLACLIAEEGNRRGAVELLESVLTDQLRVLGPEHPNTRTTGESLRRWRDARPVP